MAGIKKVFQRREEEAKAKQQNTINLWLKDGDKAYGMIVPDGGPDDLRFDSVFVHTFPVTYDNGSVGRRTILCPKTFVAEGANFLRETCETCSEDSKAYSSEKFAFWMYVFNVLHDKQRDETWEELKGVTGQVKYKEEVNAFKVFSMGPGKNDYLLKQLVDLYNEQGALNKTMVSISRSGAGMKDTSYNIALVTNRKGTIPKEQLIEAKKLAPIKEVFVNKLASVSEKVKPVLEEIGEPEDTETTVIPESEDLF